MDTAKIRSLKLVLSILQVCLSECALVCVFFRVYACEKSDEVV